MVSGHLLDCLPSSSYVTGAFGCWTPAAEAGFARRSRRRGQPGIQVALPTAITKNGLSQGRR